MNQANKFQVSRFIPTIWEIASLIISIAFFYLILVNRSPNYLRPISMSLRTGFGLVIPVTALLLYLGFRLTGRIGELISLTITVSLFAMPLAGLWASGQTQTTVLSGLIPFYDAESYYIDALRLINGFDFSIFSARRSLFPGLLAVLLSWTGQNLMAALGILTLTVAFACYLTVKQIRSTYGAEVATFVLIILFLFFRAHSGISMSENLGTALGTLGFTLLWQGASKKNLFYLCFGLFVTTLALNARAGAFFLLPVLILWMGWQLRGEKLFAWRAAFLAVFAVICGFVLNLILTRVIATSEGVPFANFSYTLYGLASGGKSWAYIFDVHPEIISMQEPEKTRKIYQLAFDLMRTHPFQTFQGAFYNWSMLFSNSWYNIYSYVGGENWTINIYARWIMYILGLTGIYSWLQNHNDAIKSLIVLSFLGVLISVPFLPPTDAYRMRPYAASIIVLAALPALGLDFVLKRMNLKFLALSNDLTSPSLAPLILSFLLISITLAGPIILKLISIRISLKPTTCTYGQSDFILVHFDPGTYVNIKKQGSLFLDSMPDFHEGEFRKSAHSLVDQELSSWAESLEPPTTIFLSLDFRTNQKVLVAYKTEVIPSTGRYYQFCGNFETDPLLETYRIFYPNETIPLSP